MQIHHLLLFCLLAGCASKPPPAYANPGEEVEPLPEPAPPAPQPSAEELVPYKEGEAAFGSQGMYYDPIEVPSQKEDTSSSNPNYDACMAKCTKNLDPLEGAEAQARHVQYCHDYKCR
jgi:hypothetical protein